MWVICCQCHLGYILQDNEKQLGGSYGCGFGGGGHDDDVVHDGDDDDENDDDDDDGGDDDDDDDGDDDDDVDVDDKNYDIMIAVVLLNMAKCMHWSLWNLAFWIMYTPLLLHIW